MEDNKTYFGEIGHGLKTLAVGMKTTWKEYFKDFFTNKSTEQYPENRKTTLHVAKRHRGRLTFKRNEDGSYKCTACTLCERDRQEKEGARRLSVRPWRLHVLPALYERLQLRCNRVYK